MYLINLLKKVVRYQIMVKCRYIKKYLRYSYSWFNYGKSTHQRKRNRRLGNHIIRSRQKGELKKLLEEMKEDV